MFTDSKLVRIVAMLTKLVARFDPEQYRVGESALSPGAPFEDDERSRSENPPKRPF
jgi:hypothetical protein